uniref:Uncharacterized protein n=1 Tax=Anguilla anguilla TaxID=7936 RepID=A0A0E9WQG1_ANGAN
MTFILINFLTFDTNHIFNKENPNQNSTCLFHVYPVNPARPRKSFVPHMKNLTLAILPQFDIKFTFNYKVLNFLTQ